MAIPTPTPPASETLRLADDRIVIAPQTLQLEVDGEIAEWATPQRVRLLSILASTPDAYVPREDLATQIYKVSDPSSHACINVHLSNIRIGLGEKLGDPDTGVIRTQRGFGYCAISSLTQPIRPIIDKTASIHTVADGRLVTDGQTQTIYVDGKPVEGIKPTEFRLAHALTTIPGLLHSRAQLQEMLGINAQTKGSRAVHMHIGSLRRKLGPELGDTDNGVIRTKRRVGYCAVRSL